MTETKIDFARVLAGLLALLVAWIHILHPQLGIIRLLLYFELGTIFDPRPPLFVLSGIVLLTGVVLGIYDVRRRLLYLGGIGLMLVYITGYVSWHTVLEHGAFWPHIHSHGHGDVGFVENMVSHLAADSIAAISKLSEAVLLGVLVFLFVTDRDSGRRSQ